MEAVENLSLVALTPAELPATQSALVEWCARKLAALAEVVADLDHNLEIAKRNMWRTASISAALTRERQRIRYYEKIKAAVEAGFLLIPNLPVDVFAVRVHRAPRHTTSNYEHSRALTTATTTAPSLGQGHYVDNAKPYEDHSYQVQENGKTVTKPLYVSREYDDEWDFPVTAVKPVVLEAMARAMALKVFDTMGTVQNVQATGDPIVVGQIVDPTRRGRMATFFIAWWLNTEDL